MLPATPSRLNAWIRRLVFAGLLGALLWSYLGSALTALERAAQAPPRPLEARQLALTGITQQDLQPDFSRSFSEPLERLVPHRTDGWVQPVWPWLAAWTYEAQDPNGSRLRSGSFRLGLSLAFLALLALASARQFSLAGALLVVLLTAFQGQLPVVAEFSGAALFGQFFLLTWAMCLYSLHRNSLWTYGLTGMAGALAYLCEDRMLPLLLGFAAISSLRALAGWAAAHGTRAEGTTLWEWRNQVFGLLLLAAGFLFLAGPRLAEAHQRYGAAFFNPVDQVRWLDDSASARRWLENGDPAAPPARETPTLGQYLQTHDRSAIHQRLGQGLGRVGQWLGDRGGPALAALLALLAGVLAGTWLATPRADHAGQRLHPETATQALFVIAVTAAYGLIAAWDAAVLAPDHLQALIGPLALSLVWGCESLLRRACRRGRAGTVLAQGYRALLWALLLWQTLPLLPGLRSAP